MFKLPSSPSNPIRPKSWIQLVRADRRTPAWKNEIGQKFRVGYYTPNDGLDCIWIVNNRGEYIGTIDQAFLKKYFKILTDSRDHDLFGLRRNKLRALKKTVAAPQKTKRPSPKTK